MKSQILETLFRMFPATAARVRRRERQQAEMIAKALRAIAAEAQERHIEASDKPCSAAQPDKRASDAGEVQQ